MAHITQATTPDVTLTVEDFDARGMNVYVTIRQGSGRIVTLSGDRLTVTAAEDHGVYTTTIVFRLTQQETMVFSTGTAYVQARFIDAQGTALATEVQPVSIDQILLKTVLKYE